MEAATIRNTRRITRLRAQPKIQLSTFILSCTSLVQHEFRLDLLSSLSRRLCQ